ncbi:MAG: amidohydrolase family protein, partial [Halobaculum sp.]
AAAREAHFQSIRDAYDAGVHIAAGTDFIGPDLVPHGKNALEAELLVEEIGLSEREAIEAGTRVAARTVPDDDLGVLAEGNRADFLAFETDPLADIGALSAPDAVFKSGERVDGTL